MTYTIIRGSYQPGLRFVLRDASGNAISLAGMTSARLVAAVRNESEEESLLVDKALTVAGAASQGVLVGTWLSSETDIRPGTYKAQVEVTYDGEEEVAKYGPFSFVVVASVTK